MEERQKKGSSLVFAVNGERFELPSIDPSTTLLHFLRSDTCFKSPKLGCGEGGCGACVVLVSKYDLKLKKVEDFSVSSCLTLLCSLNGCSITTSEGLGNTRDGFHSIHERFAGFHASQCGFCTPGMCMSFFSALVNADKGNKPDPPPGFSKLTSSEAENAIAGNLCRCTGYRPIADACKTFAADIDIEDLGFNAFWKSGDSKEMKVSKLPPYDPTKNFNTYPEFLKSESTTNLDSSRYSWYSPVSIEELQSLLNSNVMENGASFKLVVGNTGTGYYKETQRYDHYVDLRCIPELSIFRRDKAGIEVGATVTIYKLISFLKEESKITFGSYGKLVSDKLAYHMEKIASPFIRNSASVGGNLVMAQKNGFPSDIATLFLGLCATVSLMTGHGLEELTWEELLSRPPLDSKTLLLSFSIPFKKDQNSKFLFETYRTAPRPHGNALAYVNAAFQADVSLCQNGFLINNIRLAFGAYGTKHATRAKTVEGYLTGKMLNLHVLYEALKLVNLEVVPEYGTLHPEYRSSLAVSYVFQFLHPFTDARSAISSGLLSGINDISVEEVSKRSKDSCISQGRKETLLSSAKQVVESSTEYYPVGEPMKKVGAAMQAAGEAVYVDDIPSPPNCLHGAFIYSTKALAGVKGIQLESNQLTDGVAAVITFKDIPSGGANVGAITFDAEPLFAEDLAQCAGDRIAVVVADSQRSADVAARTALVEYDTANIDTSILTVEEAVEKSSFIQIPPSYYPKQVGDFSKGMAEADHKILSAEVRLGSEYHFYMETQTALAIPDEDNCMVVYSSIQCPENAHRAIATCLGVPEHNIRVITRRVGGGFGGKSGRAMTVATACALAAYKLRKPVRIYVNRNSDMIMTGGRHPMKVTYSVGFKSSGKITALHLDLLINAGISEDKSLILPSNVIKALKKYDWGALSFDVKLCKTNLTSKSTMRAPGEVQGSYIAEAIIEHVSSSMSMEVDSVRNKTVHTFESLNLFYDNIVSAGEYTLPSIMDKLAVSSSFFQRSKIITQFNENNTWKKRGISRVPIVYEATQRPTPGKVSILQDGSIVVEVGGIEIGQGLWTKVKQMTAYALGLIESSWAEDLVEKVRVIQADTLSIVQGGLTSGSTTSESSCEAVRLCCNALVERLTPLKIQLQEQNVFVDWPTLIRQAQMQSVNLAANSYYVPESGSTSYLNFGAAVSEVEIDILIGETTILQSDIIYDCGQSLNPAVDMGQIEGSFVQGIGFFMHEEYLTNEEGLMVSNSTWTYKIPTIDTIPRNFNVHVVNSGHHEKRVLSSKASGEPPLLLAATVHCATRAAIKAAREQLKLWDKLDGSVSEFYLDIPAILPVVKTQCGLDYVERYLEMLLDQDSILNMYVV